MLGKIGIKIQGSHLHAASSYGSTSFTHFLKLSMSILIGKILKVQSVTAHLPLEIQHPEQFPLTRRGLVFLKWGELLKRIFHVKLYWENAPLLNYGTWDLKYDQTNWKYIPRDIDLCLDIGHLILKSKNVSDARERIEAIITKRGDQIRHLHIHENDLVHDLHLETGKIVNKKLLGRLLSNRSYIYEK